MVKLAGKETGLSIPRRSHRQTQRSNLPATTAKEYRRLTVFIPFLDHLLCELNDRFTSSKSAVHGFWLLPVKTKKMDVKSVSADLLEAYHEDLPDVDSLFAELRMWKSKWEAADKEGQGSTISQTLEETIEVVSGQELLFPNVWQVLKLLAVNPVTSSTVERANSALDFANPTAGAQ